MKNELFAGNILDHKPRLFLSRILYTLFKRVALDENRKEELKRIHREGTVVYAIKYRGRLDYLLYHYNFRMKRLPYPKLAFALNISTLLPLRTFLRCSLARFLYLLRHGEMPDPYRLGFYKEAIQNGTTSLIFLVDPKGFSRQFVHAQKDDLHLLLDTQSEMERPIFIVPQLILYKRSPERQDQTLSSILFGFKEHPGVIRKMALFFRHNRRAFIDFGEPLNLREYLDNQSVPRSHAEIAVELREDLIARIDAQKRIILGPIMKSRQQIKEIVLRDEGIHKHIERTAEGNPKRSIQLRKKAGEYFDEIAADFNMAYIEFFHWALTWFFNRLFEGIDVDIEGMAKVREWARKGSIVYVPSHKSHIDYLALNYILHNAQMHIPRIAAGKNLAFWPMGHVFRKSGAFFIRRTFKGARLYREVFGRYIKALIEEGHPLEFFIEGGRSRSGKVILPKIGFLTVLIQAFQEGYCRDMVFVPASISYDRILEEKAYLKELAGGEKEKENIRQVIRARHFLKRKYGKIYIRFGEPVSLKDYLAVQHTGDMKPHKQIAFHLIRSINSVTLVTPLSLVASAVLTAHRGGFTADELHTITGEYLAFLRSKRAPTASTLESSKEAVEETLSLLQSWKVVSSLEVTEEEEETFYYVEDEKKVELEFYKNNIIHFFIHHAMVAASLLKGEEEVRPLETLRSDYLFLRDLFRKEFILVDPLLDDRDRVQSVLTDFMDSGLIREDAASGGYRITRMGAVRLPAWARFAKTYLESYWIVVQTLLQKEKKPLKRGDELKAMKLNGLRFHKLGVIDHLESVSQLTFRNALDCFAENGFRTAGDNAPSESKRELSDIGKRIYDLARFQG
ncbi:MAG: 1-acyl-sn-glycerol-3-phosphate acyltransferase [Desulfobacteraceae bacterium]